MQLSFLEPVGHGPTCLRCATPIEPIRPRICECRFLGSPQHAFKYMCMQLISYDMGSRNSQNAITSSDVTPCRALQKLNHLVNLVTCLFKLKPSKPQQGATIHSQTLRVTHSSMIMGMVACDMITHRIRKAS